MEKISEYFSFGGAMGLLSMGFLMVAYLVPSFVAMQRGLKQTASIFVLNFFMGWTVIGWVLALMLALWPWANTPAKKVDELPNLYLPEEK